MFIALTVVGCGILIPVNLVAGLGFQRQYNNIGFLLLLTPQYLLSASPYWAYVVVAWLFDFIICYFLWHTYRAVTRLRRAYFQSPEYQNSLHSRTLLITAIPKNLRTDEGIVKLAEEAKSTGDVPRAVIARNVKDLPDLVEEHEQTVRDLEAHLAKYLKNPNQLPAKRPTCKVSKTDQSYRKGQKVDAIEYLTARIKELEVEIKQVRESVDKRNAMPYGFASYQSIYDAHNVAYATRKKAPHGTGIRLAPKPHDLIWKNLPMTQKQRNWQNLVNNLWVALLTVAWIAPNVLSSVFLSNLSHLGLLWPAFQTSYYAHPTGWGIVQGVAAPAITNIFYYFLPVIFRKLSMNAGDMTKTSRERHVMHKLFSFFFFNNFFIYSLFSALWTYIVAVIGASKNESAWDAIRHGNLFTTIVTSLISMSTYWLTWLLQRNLGAAIDLAQAVNLAWGSFSRRFLSPTPRQVIELSAPQPFEYAEYYNYFLFYSTIALCFAPLQPLVLPVTAFYFWLDSHLKKYLLLYVFITKVESGGQFWRVLFNRMIFNALAGNLVIALLVGARQNWVMLACIGPLPFLLLAFKWYCARTFDDQCRFYSKGVNMESEAAHGSDIKAKRADRVGVRFGHPVLYKPLITPMVHAKAQHILRTIYAGRTSIDIDNQSVAGYSDVYMDPMSRTQTGKPAPSHGLAPFEIVNEGELDFEHYKNRPEFRDQLGGDGELYGRPADLLRRGSGQSNMTSSTMAGFMGPAANRSRSESRESERTHIGNGGESGGPGGTVYPSGYHKPSISNLRDHSPGTNSIRSVDMTGPGMRSRLGSNATDDSFSRHLLQSAARMGRSPPPAPSPGGYGPIRARSASRSASRGPAVGGSGARGRAGGAYLTETPPGQEEETSYDYFRRGRQI